MKIHQIFFFFFFWNNINNKLNRAWSSSVEAVNCALFDKLVTQSTGYGSPFAESDWLQLAWPLQWL